MILSLIQHHQQFETKKKTNYLQKKQKTPQIELQQITIITKPNKNHLKKMKSPCTSPKNPLPNPQPKPILQQQNDLQQKKQQNEKTLDEDGYEHDNGYKSRQIKLLPLPQDIKKLSQIYNSNVLRKNRLKAQIQQKIGIQLKSLRLSYDKQHQNVIQQYIDLDYQSRQYLQSKQLYQKRKLDIQLLSNQYQQIKNLQIQCMMMVDAVFVKNFQNYVKNNKRIIQCYVLNDQVFVLNKEVLRKKKNKKEKTHQSVQKSIRNVNYIENQQITKQFTIRSFRFYKTQNGVSFQPKQQVIYIPLKNPQYIGFCIDPLSQNYTIYKKQSIQILTSDKKQIQIKHTLNTDTQIIFCDYYKNYLYIGCKDSILKIYEIKQNNNILLTKILICISDGSRVQTTTHYCFTSNMQSILFVKGGTQIYQMNLKQYTCTQLAKVSQQIIRIQPQFIKTKNYCYTDYYIPATTVGANGKIILKNNQKLGNLGKKGDIVKVQKYLNQIYVVINQGLGVFYVECL